MVKTQKQKKLKAKAIRRRKNMSENTFGKLDSWGSRPTSNASGADKDDFLNLRDDGTYRVRIVSGRPYKFQVHWVRDTSGKMRRVKCAARDCPLCKEGDEAQVRYMSAVIDRSDGRVKVMEFPRSVFNALADMYNDEEWGDPMNYDIKIIKNKSAAPRDKYKTSGIPSSIGRPSEDEMDSVTEFTDRVSLDKLSAPLRPAEVLRILGRDEPETSSSTDDFVTPAAEATTDSGDDEFDFE